MKKWTVFMGAGVLAFGLSACGQTAEPAEGSDENANTNAESELTLEEVFANSTEATEQANSLHADIVTNQQMTMQPGGMEMNMEMNSAMDMTQDPLAFHQTSETSIVSEDIENENPVAMEMYFTEDGMYMHEATMDTWLKMTGESVEQLKSLADEQTADPSQQLEQLAGFQDDFTFKQTEEEYILTLDASGEKFKELINQQMDKTLGQIELEAQTALEDMTIHHVFYEIFIDKETFLTNNMNMEMSLDMNIEEETMSIQTDVQVDYSKYNEIEEITVPQEVIDQAQEMAF
ncbi:DUF6612 family protein [Planococcus salinus]|uniref:Lipoprotein n=1 Tax=Planococcus salinus TaxID=1848460 RepID=A0A3M8P6G3_9BACL|nr:DUF6612 family protein [Planococcus salinus]RNF39268.1 hypothetical protein EEX84_11055 [Planococcus salinus]